MGGRSRRICARERPTICICRVRIAGVWNEEALAASKEIILCESLIDALSFWSAGFRNVTASYGVNGFTADHRAAFEKHGTERVYIAYDRDEAGDKAAAALAEELMQMGIECFRVQFPKGMDANEYALKVQPAAKSLGVLLNKAEWLGKGKRPERAMQPCRDDSRQSRSRSRASSQSQQRSKQRLKKKSSKKNPSWHEIEASSNRRPSKKPEPAPQHPPSKSKSCSSLSRRCRSRLRRGASGSARTDHRRAGRDARRRHLPHAGRPPLSRPWPE